MSTVRQSRRGYATRPAGRWLHSGGAGRSSHELGAFAVSLSDEAIDRIAGAVVDRLRAVSETDVWLTSHEAAKYLRLPSLDALHRLTGAGAVPHVKQGGRCLFRRSELDRWLDDHYSGPPR